MTLPVEFKKFALDELGAGEAADFFAALEGDPVVSIRFNPFKLSALPEKFNRMGLPCPGEVATDATDGMVCESVPWNRYGAYLSERPVFTLDPALHAGAYYVQEASSQFVEHLLRGAFSRGGDPAGDMPEGMRILDLCAAPGGKTTLYSTLAGPSGLVVANEVVRTRAGVLADNVRRWGIGNVAVTCSEPRDFRAFRHWFDVLAVDAPCSGEGMFRKNRAARDEWSPASVELCAARQRHILTDAWEALRPGGVLIYSTCTFNRRENEENVAWLAQQFDVEPVAIDTPASCGIETGEISDIKTFRFWPHRVRGEGFFAAVMRKADGRVKRETPRPRREPLSELNRPDSRPLAGWVTQPEAMRFARAGDNCYAFYRPQYQAIAALAGTLNVICSGVCLGQLFGGRPGERAGERAGELAGGKPGERPTRPGERAAGKLRPDHALALFHDLNRTGLNIGELRREEALDYLRKNPMPDPTRDRLAEGLNLLIHNGLPIGWAKRIGHRTNSLLPTAARIVNL